MRKKVFFNTALVLLVLFLFSSFSPSSAQAHSLVPHSHVGSQGAVKTATAAYDPNDPADSGCNQHANYLSVPLTDNNGNVVGYLENWYSTSCVKNWARVEYNYPTINGIKIVIESNTTQCIPTDCLSDLYYGPGPDWTDMVDGHGQACATAIYGSPTVSTKRAYLCR